MLIFYFYLPVKLRFSVSKVFKNRELWKSFITVNYINLALYNNKLFLQTV